MGKIIDRIRLREREWAFNRVKAEILSRDSPSPEDLERYRHARAVLGIPPRRGYESVFRPAPRADYALGGGFWDGAKPEEEVRPKVSSANWCNFPFKIETVRVERPEYWEGFTNG